MNFIKTLLAKWVGGKWILSAVTSIVAFALGYLNGIPLDLSPEELSNFGELLGKVLKGLFDYGLAALLALDYAVGKMSKPDVPKIVKE